MIKVNSKEINITKFPNNESLINTDTLNKELENKEIKVDFKFYNNEDILNLLLVLGHIHYVRNEERHIWNNITLTIYYMPYSRMDRNQNGNCFTLLHICELLSCYLTDTDYVNIIEPHSDKTVELLTYSIIYGCLTKSMVKRINVITPLMNKILSETKIDVICYPDKGAKERFADDEVTLPIVYCEKKRDFDTGKILGLDLVTDIDLNDKNVLILDDLSSAGGTFYYTALKLREYNINEVYLGICHCEETIRKGKIFNDGVNNETPINHIYCLDTMLPPDSQVIKLGKNITVYSTEQFLEKGEFVEVNKCLIG